MPRSLVWATSIDVLPPDRIVERRDGFLVVRSPGNPTHWWGNLLLFDDPPAPGDGERWEDLFVEVFGGDPRVRHRTLAWDRTDGVRGVAEEEFAARGYDVEETIGLIAAPEEIHDHPRANRDVEVRALDPHPGSDEPLWEQVVEIQLAGRDSERDINRAIDEEVERVFTRTRQGQLRELFVGGRGAWYVALDGGDVVASLGVVVTDGRGRYQTVDTAKSHRRRGISSRLLVDAARHAASTFGATQLVIGADPDYHAVRIYESVGFQPIERVCGVCRPSLAT